MKGATMAKKTIELIGLYGEMITHPCAYCKSKGVYLRDSDIKLKGCTIPNRKRPQCRHLMELYVNESRYGILPDKLAQLERYRLRVCTKIRKEISNED